MVLSLMLLSSLLLSKNIIAAEQALEDIPAVTLVSLIASSRKLVSQAATGSTHATTFRINATLFRESLRSFMLARENGNSGSDGLSKTDLINLVRMSALLQSAADCKTGRYIVCPPELMQQLRSQQALLEKLPNKSG
jgi:hypothetical protein